MNSDLSNCVEDDWVCTVIEGWCQLIQDDGTEDIPLLIGEAWYTKDGKDCPDDKFPSAYIEPPAEWNAGPRPINLKKGDKVLVGDNSKPKYRRYFAHMNGNKFACFVSGADEWSSGKGMVKSWNTCIKYEGE